MKSVVPSLESFLQDVRFAARNLKKERLVTSLVVLSLALTIAGNTTVFGLARSIVMRPLPYPEPWQIVMLGDREERQPASYLTSPANLKDWRERSRSFTDLAGFRVAALRLGDPERPEQVMAAQVSRAFSSSWGPPCTCLSHSRVFRNIPS